MAKVEIPSSTSAAATSSCVLSGFEAQSVMSAPPACSVDMRCAVSLVTCRQAETRTPLSGFCLRNRSWMLASTGMDRAAHSIRPRPFSASFRSLTSCGLFIFARATGCLRKNSTTFHAEDAEEGEGAEEIRFKNRILRALPHLCALCVKFSSLDSCGAGGRALEAGGGAEGVGAVGPLPGELGLAAAEVPVGGGLLV